MSSSSNPKRVRFDPSSCGTSSGMEMEPDLSLGLQERGATVVLSNVPPGTEIGIDLNTWNVGNKFMGIKMIPPGIHFVYWRLDQDTKENERSLLTLTLSCSPNSSSVSLSHGGTSPRTGFFHDFSVSEVIAKKYDRLNEEFVDFSPEDVNRIREDLKNLDSGLGPYPFESWKKWVSLTNRISANTISRWGMQRGEPLKAFF